MTKRIFILLSAGLATACILSCSKSAEDDALQRLEETIADKDKYEQEFLRRVESLKATLGQCSNDSIRWSVAHNLYKEYLSYNLDSALVYSDMMSRLADSREKDMIVMDTKVSCYCGLRLYPSAQELLSRVDTTSLNDREKHSYYNAYIRLYTALGNEFHTEEEEEAEANLRKRHYYQDKLSRLSLLTPQERKYMKGKQLMIEKEFDQALDSLHAVMEMGQDISAKLHTTYAIANCYKAKGDKNAYKRWLAKTAIYDIKRPNKQYRSLYDLALLLHEDGDDSQAGEFIHLTVLDAISCKYDTRIINAVEAQIIIEAANQEQAQKERWMLFSFIFVMIIAIICISFAFAKVNRQRKRLKMLMRRVKEQNIELSEKSDIISEANLIKEKYMFKYMYLSANFIKEMEDYRKDLRHTHKEEGVEAMIAKLREPEYIYHQYKSFYRLFDEIFLSIFPEFPEKVNCLMKEGKEIHMKDKGVMPTEMRILAVIRLGITESRKIAEFLNTSVNTIYTYRTKMRYDSIDGPDNFENKIKNIDLFK